jgi:hypothetical protein
MSIIKHSPINLSEVVKESNLIVQVKCLKPFTEEVQTNQKNATSTFPPFIKKGFVFSVQKILKNTTGNNAIPELIKVPDENWRRFMSQHLEHHANGPSRSYHVREYETEVSSIKHATILFLNYFQNMFDLTAKDSFESVASLEKIEMLMAAKQRY